MKIILILLVLSRIVPISLMASDSIWWAATRATEIELQQLMEKGKSTRDDKTKAELNHRAVALFEGILADSRSFAYPFDSLTTVGRVVAPDSLFRVINWNSPRANGLHDYFAFIQYYDKKTGVYKVTKLNHVPYTGKDFEHERFDQEKWYGCLYYRIIKTTWQNRTFYTILGIDFNNFFTNKKFIDVLQFDKNLGIQFGYPFFQVPGKVKSRVAFEYSSRVVMSLRYHDDVGMIVFDHLSPSEPRFKDMPEYYGPDFSYDAFVFEKGRWVFRGDIELTGGGVR